MGRVPSALVLALVLLGPACGTRVDRSAQVETGTPGAATPGAGAPGTAAEGSSDLPEAPGTAPAGTEEAFSTPNPAAPAAGPTRTPGRPAPSAAAAPSPPGGAAVVTSSTRPGGQAGPSASRHGSPERPAPAPAPPAVAPGGSPAVVASVGTYSGPAAATLKPVLDGAQLWTKAVNARGGLNGHPVKLLVYDDGGDPARHRAQVQEAVEQKKVIAFLANAEALTGNGSDDYIASNRVPVIGVDGGWDFPYDNPMYFLQHPSGQPLYLSFILSTAQQVVPAGKTKLAALTCHEAQACGIVSSMWRERAKGLGFDLVYEGRASVAQPDYTAECLAARNAGAQTFFVLLDGNSVTRLAGSCARQGYKPQYALPTTVILDRFKDDPNLDGAVGGSDVLPWFQTGLPAADEFHGALKAFGGGLAPGVGMVTGWTAGKLLERAGRSLPEPPTSESVLRGLWSIRDDTLGGLTYPLTFGEGKTSVRKTCWFTIKVKGGRWESPDGNRQFCGQ